jgi:hypothetical protein
MAGVLESTTAHSTNHLEFCPRCLNMCDHGEILKQPVSISARDQRGSECRLCCLLLSMSAFAQQMQIDPLRSYEIKFLPLIGDLPIVGLDFILPVGHDQSETLTKKPRLPLSPASFSIVETYSDRGRYKDKGVFTMQLVRSVSLQSRLPSLGFEKARTAFRQVSKSVHLRGHNPFNRQDCS